MTWAIKALKKAKLVQNGEKEVKEVTTFKV